MKTCRGAPIGILLVGACDLLQLAEVPNASAVATTFYVSKGGSDTGTCQSATAPCASLSYAVYQAFDAMALDATIDVGPGTFKASLGVNPEGFYLTIQGSGPKRVQATTLEPEARKGSIVDANRGGWTLDRLTLNGRSGDPVVSSYAGSIDLVDSTIKNSANAVMAAGSTRSKLHGWPKGNCSEGSASISGPIVKLTGSARSSSPTSWATTRPTLGAWSEASGT
jgi:hypothetical protein